MRTSLLLLLVGAVIAAINLQADGDPSASAVTVDWPAEFEGRPLEQMPLSATEEAFARSFPGAIGVFKSGDNRQVILRRVGRATRRLHDSATCLKAAGFSIEGRFLNDGWLCYRASKGGQVFDVREQIAGVGEHSWTDVSDWFWHATFHRDAGPWLAVTVLDGR